MYYFLDYDLQSKSVTTKDERSTMVYAVKVLVKNDGKIKIGMPGEVRFIYKDK